MSMAKELAGTSANRRRRATSKKYVSRRKTKLAQSPLPKSGTGQVAKTEYNISGDSGRNGRSMVLSPIRRVMLEVPVKEEMKKYNQVRISADTVRDVMTSWLWATRVIDKDEVVHDVVYDNGTYLVRLEKGE